MHLIIRPTNNKESDKIATYFNDVKGLRINRNLNRPNIREFIKFEKDIDYLNRLKDEIERKFLAECQIY